MSTLKAKKAHSQLEELLRAGCKISELAEKLGAPEVLLRHWIEQVHHDVRHHDAVMARTERMELQRLRRENIRLTMQRDILLKAAAWFSRENLPTWPRPRDL